MYHLHLFVWNPKSLSPLCDPYCNTEMNLLTENSNETTHPKLQIHRLITKNWQNSTFIPKVPLFWSHPFEWGFLPWTIRNRSRMTSRDCSTSSSSRSRYSRDCSTRWKSQNRSKLVRTVTFSRAPYQRDVIYKRPLIIPVMDEELYHHTVYLSFISLRESFISFRPVQLNNLNDLNENQITPKCVCVCLTCGWVRIIIKSITQTFAPLSTHKCFHNILRYTLDIR